MTLTELPTPIINCTSDNCSSLTTHTSAFPTATETRLEKDKTSDKALTPAAAFRNEYYLSQQHIMSDVNTSKVEDGGIDDSIYSPTDAVLNAPLDMNEEEELKSLSDKEYDICTTAMESDPKTILFESTSGIEPKIVLQEDDREPNNTNNGSTLLSKLSKSTAPMRAKLSTLSRNKTNLDHLWASSSAALTFPLRKTSDSTHNSPTSKENKRNEKCYSFSFFDTTLNVTSQHSTNNTANRHIYPALLSKVAYVFKESMVVGTKTKDSIQYHDVFDGRDAIDKLTAILKTSDRNLAILVGRALDHQKFFHDVNYEHRLRDSANELYKFREHQLLISPKKRTIIKRKFSLDSIKMGDNKTTEKEEEVNTIAEYNESKNLLPNGVFTLLTDCYSPTCSIGNMCYSSLCPRRFKQSSQNLFFEENEKKRQENIFELIYTEKDFVDDLVYIEEKWIKHLLFHGCIPVDRRNAFIHDLFWNLPDIRKNNALLLNDLLQRQLFHKVVYEIGDLFLKHVPNLFGHFIDYGSHQIISKYIFETEKSINPSFAKFVQAVERLRESRKLELNGYLTKPTTRLGRYNLLLREILKHTPVNHPDHENIPKVMKLIDQFLQKVNEETGKTENRFGLEILEKKLMSIRKNGQNQDINELDLLADDRKIIMKGPLKRKNTANNASSEASELQVYVLDHFLLLIKPKIIENSEIFKLYRKPIPLALLLITLPDQIPISNKRSSSSILPYNRSSTGSFYSTNGSSDLLSPSPLLSNSTSSASSSPVLYNSKNGYPISFTHLGRQGAGLATTILYASTSASRQKWVDTIETHRNAVIEKKKVFTMTQISCKYFHVSFNRVNCIAIFNCYLLFGCDHGVYLKKSAKESTGIKEENEDGGFVHIISIEKVSQIDILEGSRLMLVLADNTSRLVNSIKNTTQKHSPSMPLRRISNNVSFFKVGKVHDKSSSDKPLERILVCYVKYNAMTSTIRALEPCHETISDHSKKKKKHRGSVSSSNVTNKPYLGLFIRNSNDSLRVFKDLYIPGEATSLQYFKNVICVGSAKGFQMVDIGSAGVQSVLDPSDESHGFINQRETLKPVSMFRHPDGCILLCYNEIAFYIDKKGRRIRPDWLINWEGQPTAFAYRHPYVLAFDSSFIEVRHVNTGDLTQIIIGNNIRCLRSDPPEAIYFVMNNRQTGNEIVINLNDFTKI
ncbi:MAG: CNH domain-containing protein [Benjaminiella poitrasii]|nr:MAG: CNH domain-containing protein [Benjaminiella poitrasii]